MTTTATLANPQTDFYRTVEAATEVDKKRRLIYARINSCDNDRFNTVIDPEGAEYDDFMRAGGPVLYEHGMDTKVGKDIVANVESIELKKDRDRRSLIAAIRFLDDDEFSKKLGDRYLRRVARGFSIRGLPDPEMTSAPTKAERAARADWAKAELVYRRWTLVEVSCTSTPGNPRCVSLERSAGKSGGLAGIADGFMTAGRDGIFTVYRNAPITIDGKTYYEQRIIATTDDEALARLMCRKS
jgi:hypothetical protein